MVELAVGGDLALELHHVLGARVHFAQRAQPDQAGSEHHRHDREERHQQLGVDRGARPRDQPRQPIGQPLHLPGASASSDFRSPRNSFGSKRTPRYCTRSVPRLVDDRGQESVIHAAARLLLLKNGVAVRDVIDLFQRSGQEGEVREVLTRAHIEPFRLRPNEASGFAA